MNRTGLFLLTLLMACAPEPGPVVESGPPAKPLRVVVLGDRTGNARAGAFEAALREARRLSPDLLISVGDLIEGYQSDDQLDRTAAEWDEIDRMTKRLTGDLPLFAAAGNHDVWSAKSQALFEKRMGCTVNHVLDIGHARFIFFDTSRYTRESDIPEAALNWLWRALRQAREQAVRIVVTHAPTWAIDPGGRYGSPMHDVLIAGRADWVLTGHWHHAMSDDRDGIRYRLIGPSGATPNRPGHPESGNLNMIGLMIIDDNQADLSLISAGSVRPSDAYPYRFNQMEWAIEHRAVQVTGFDFNPTEPRLNGRLKLVVTNVTDAPLAGTLGFTGERPGWQIRPATRRVALEPGASVEFSFHFQRHPDTPLFPGPRLTLPFPWEQDQTYLLDTRITPTLTHRVKTRKAALKIDGKLDETDWRSAGAIGPLQHEAGPPIPGNTVARTLVGEHTLFIGIGIQAPDIIKDDDYLIVLLDPHSDDRHHAKLRVTAAGAVDDHLYNAEGAARSTGVEVAVHRSDKAWSVELAISLEALGIRPETSKIGFNLGRGRPGGPIESKAFWQPLLEHDNDSFGVLIIE